MKHVEPKVYLVARSEPDKFKVSEWLRDHGCNGDTVDRMTLNAEKTPGDQIVECAGRRCYMSFEPKLNPNVTRIREDIGEYIDNILKVGHGSVTEHVTYSFAIENVSRVFTGEMNRHRAGMAISEGSMRFIRFDDIPFWVPTCIRLTEEEQAALDFNRREADETGSVSKKLSPLILKKTETQRVFDRVFSYIEREYGELCEIWKEELADDSKFKNKKNVTSMMRRIIPMGIATGGIWTGNLRAWRHIITMRGDEQAEEEIYLVACMIFEELVKAEPHFFKDFVRDESGFLRPKHRKV